MWRGYYRVTSYTDFARAVTHSPHFSTGFSTSMPELTASQCSDLIEQYVELCIDGMDHKDMYHFIYNTLVEDFDNLSEEELLNEIECSFDTETLNELVDNVTTDIKPVDPSTYTYGIEPGESLSFPVHGT